MNAFDGNEETGYASDQGDQKILGQKLAHDAPAAGAQGAANGQFVRARARAREDEVGDVGASDEEHETDRPEQGQDGGPDPLHQVFVERDHVEPDAGIPVDLRILPRQICGDGVYLALGTFERDSGSQPRDRGEGMIAAAGSQTVSGQRSQKEEINSLRQVCSRPQVHSETSRHHGHHGRVEVVHFDLPADDLLVASEPRLPELVTDHHVPHAVLRAGRGV